MKLAQMLTDYYCLRRWEQKEVSTQEKLVELGLAKSAPPWMTARWQEKLRKGAATLRLCFTWIYRFSTRSVTFSPR